MDFIKRTATDTDTPMPLHTAFKAVKYLNPEGRTVQAETPMSWKFEKFIFDLLPRTDKIGALLYPRETCFAPLKNFSGPDSLATVCEALEKSDRRVFEAITGQPCTVSPLEIDQAFYYPTPELLQKWQGRSIRHGGYIEAE